MKDIKNILQWRTTGRRNLQSKKKLHFIFVYFSHYNLYCPEKECYSFLEQCTSNSPKQLWADRFPRENFIALLHFKTKHFHLVVDFVTFPWKCIVYVVGWNVKDGSVMMCFLYPSFLQDWTGSAKCDCFSGIPKLICVMRKPRLLLLLYPSSPHWPWEM